MTRQLFKQLLQYGTVGLCALGVDVGVFTLLRGLGAELVTANVVARLMGAVTAYSGNHLWTFAQARAAADWWQSSWRYAVLWAGMTGLSTMLLSGLVRFGAPETLSKLGVEMLMPLLNFLISRYWVFRGAPGR
jgi:putative flippase GtrA